MLGKYKPTQNSKMQKAKNRTNCRDDATTTMKHRADNESASWTNEVESCREFPSRVEYSKNIEPRVSADMKQAKLMPKGGSIFGGPHGWAVLMASGQEYTMTYMEPSRRHVA